MDYSYDTCYEEFTSGQADRIQSYWKQYRKDATEGEAAPVEAPVEPVVEPVGPVEPVEPVS